MNGLRLSVPAHVTGFWTIHHRANPEETGSTGAGLTLKPRIEAEAYPSSRLRIELNTQEVRACTIEHIKKAYARCPGTVRIQSPYRLGAGFGVSAALSILTAASLEALRERPSLENALKTAHVAEVMCETGLGDVIAEVNGGGLVVRVKPGAPGIGETISYPVKEQVRVVAAVLDRKLDTPTMLRVYRDKIVRYGRECMRRLLRSPTLETFLELARDFSLKTGMLTDDLKSKLLILDRRMRRGEVAGYYLKKNVLLVVVDKGSVPAVREEIEKTLMCPAMTCEIEDEGFRMRRG